MDKAKSSKAGADLAAKMSADVLFYNGDISPVNCRKFIRNCNCRNRRGEVILILVTPGGDPDAAFKIGRCLQNHYPGKISVFIPGWCKSAGTLITLAANHVYIGDHGELGPLDIQMLKADELLEMGSGLTVDAAMKTLEATAAKMFFNLLISIRGNTQGMITTRTASELASSMTTKLLDPIYRQIDPMKIGENSRAINITKQYGKRLADTSGILKTAKSLDYLVSAYPDHGFVIDRTEAATMLFKSVSAPVPEMVALAEALGEAALVPKFGLAQDGTAYIEYLCPEPPKTRRPRARTPQRSQPNATPAATAKIARTKPARSRGNGEAAPNS